MDTLVSFLLQVASGVIVAVLLEWRRGGGLAVRAARHEDAAPAEAPVPEAPSAAAPVPEAPSSLGSGPAESLAIKLLRVALCLLFGFVSAAIAAGIMEAEGVAGGKLPLGHPLSLALIAIATALWWGIIAMIQKRRRRA